MERLTQHTDKTVEILGCTGCTMALLRCSVCSCLDRAKERLADYEDTALTPEEIRAMRDDYLEYQAARQTLGIHTWDWLLNVIKEGRVRVIPAKPGTMYRSKRGDVVELTAIHITSAPRQTVVYEGAAGLNACDELYFRRNFTKEEATR